MTEPPIEGIDEHTWTADDDATEAFPWPPSREPIPDAWGRTWAGATLRPATFFAALPPAARLGPAILYYLSIGILVAGAQLFWTMTGLLTEQVAMSALFGASGAWGPLLDFLFAPATLLFSLFVSAGVTHLALRAFGGAGGDAGTTVRVFAYAYSPQLFAVIPFIGPIVGFVWMVVVAIIGLRAAHRTSTARATAAVLVPLAVGLFFVVLATLLARAGELLEMPL